MAPIHVYEMSSPFLWRPCVYYLAPIHVYGMSSPPVGTKLEMAILGLHNASLLRVSKMERIHHNVWPLVILNTYSTLYKKFYLLTKMVHVVL